MRDPKNVLSSLVANTGKENYKFQRLYRNLFNPSFYLMAYGRIAPKSGNLTKGVSEQTIDGFNLMRIERLIELIKSEQYQPKSVRRTYIKKKNGKQRPLGIPSFDDKIVQEIIRMILEAIYEGTFCDSSHGFRPNRSCHTALAEIKCKFMGSKWFIEGDISSFFDTINHQILINLLRKKIEDERFIRLIWKFLKAGYMEDWKYYSTYSGCPQGGIISPILSNIYLNELDNYMKEYKENFDKGKTRQRNSEYRKIERKLQNLRKELKGLEDGSEERKNVIAVIKQLKEEQLKIPASNPMDESYKRLYYVRYCDDFIISVIGTKNDAKMIKNDIDKFLKNELDITLSKEKTLITHSNNFARFLGYDIAVSRNQAVKRFDNGMKRRPHNYQCNLFLPKDVWINKLKELDILKITKSGVWRPKPRPYLTIFSDIEILSIYNAEIRGLYNYYKLAKNVSVLNSFMYFMKYSMYMTFASKYKSSIHKILKKYQQNNLFTVMYDTSKGKKSMTLYDGGFRMDISTNKVENADKIPSVMIYKDRTELTQRLLANQCEWCDTKESYMEVHHIRKLKDLKGKKFWEQQMIARRRKTMVLCRSCHRKLHAGKLD